jgi:cyclic pyranopterin phosphate synthase
MSGDRTSGDKTGGATSGGGKNGEKKLTHIDERGQAHMVDVGTKPETERLAIASGRVKMRRATLELAESGKAKKGDVLAAARLAGIMAAKKTADLIPLCHPLALTKVTVGIEPDFDLPGYRVRASAALKGRTGVEMEALTAVSVACLTIYDMLKAADRAMAISGVRLEEKHGGKSGSYIAEGEAGHRG